MGYITENKGQSEAADVIILAMLVSFSLYLISNYGIGAYEDDYYLKSLNSRYLEDLSQSFVLTVRYLSNCNDKLTYTVGIDSKVLGNSDTLRNILEANPLERHLRINLVDLIIEDLFLGLKFQYNNSNLYSTDILAGDFHQSVERKVFEDMSFVLSRQFNYRIEGYYHPYKGTLLDNFLYSEVVYTNAPFPQSSSVYIGKASVTVPINVSILENIFLFEHSESKMLLSNFFSLQLNSSVNPTFFEMIRATHPKNNAAEIRIMLWNSGTA